MASYRSEVLSQLSRVRFSVHRHNYDPALGLEPPARPGPFQEWMSDAWADPGSVAHLFRDGLQQLRAALQYGLSPKTYFTTHFECELERGAYLYPRLADAASRDLLIKLIAHRILGHRRVKLPRNTPAYWAALEDVDRYATSDPPMPIRFEDLILPVFDATSLGYDMRLHSTGVNIARVLCQGQYAYERGAARCKVEPGDVVVDAGAGWGETTLAFAHEAGPSGVCVAFEFIPDNLAVLERNVGLNPQLANRVRVGGFPVWSASGAELHYVDWGLRSRVSDAPTRYGRPDGKASSITIDEGLKALGLNRVDFIKVDVEGAELEALKGAERSIREHRPKLAISLHKRPEDLTGIPRYIDGLKLGYTFYLEHHTLYGNGTVLFAVPQPNPLDVAFTLHTQGRLAEAETHYRDIIADDDPAGAWAARNNLFALLQDQDRFEDLEALSRTALQVAPDDPLWNQRLAVVLLRRGAYLEAWPHYDHRIPSSPHWPLISRLPYGRWEGQSVTSLLVWPEKDFGDLILFSRYLPLLRARGISVSLVCPPAIATLMAPLVDEVIPLAGALRLPIRDAWVMVGSLPGLFETTLETIPPPAPPLPRAEPVDGIGVLTAGRNTLDTITGPLLAQPGTMDLDAALADSDMLAAAQVLASLAEVVSVSTPIAHLAATLGTPTRILLPRNSTDWRWLYDRTDSPWYPAVTVAREADG